MKKAKRWVEVSFDQDHTPKPTKKNASQRKVKQEIVNPDNKNTKTFKVSSQAQDCLKRFSPKSLDEVAVNVKKIQEVEYWICHSYRTNCPEILLLSGPVGAGKTTTVQLLAKKYGIKLSEWITPLDITLPNDYGDFEFREKQSTVFLDFLLKAANFSSLISGSDVNKVVVVEDIPNIFFKNSTAFSEVLELYKSRGKSPLIFICSDSNNETSCSPLTLFSNSIKEKFKIHQISFNSISATNLKSAFKRISEQMVEHYSDIYNPPSADLIDCVVNSSGGDIRSAVLNLHFSSLKGANHMLSESIKEECSTSNKKPGKRKTAKSSKFLAIGKDETVSILHGVGRVLNPKVSESGKFVHSPSEVMEQFSSQPISFVNFIHENYLPHFSTIEQAEKAARTLSDADYLLAEWREKFSHIYGLYIAVTGLMVHNKNPVSGWNPVRGPKSMKITYPTAAELKLEEDQIHNGRVLVTDFKTYCNIINSSR